MNHDISLRLISIRSFYAIKNYYECTSNIYANLYSLLPKLTRRDQVYNRIEVKWVIERKSTHPVWQSKRDQMSFTKTCITLL